MSSYQISVSSSSPPQNVKTKVPQNNRRTADFPPSVWGDRFISYASNSLDKSEDDTNNEKTKERLKELVKSMILSPIENTSEKLDLIDVVECLGVSYHFKDEIEMILRKIYESSSSESNISEDEEDGDLYTIALKFRLLRQQGYNAPCDVFNKFRNSEGKMKKSLASDIRGILSLYEASFLRVHKEDVLDEALAFTSCHLKSMVSNSSIECPILMDKVTHALEQPLRYRLARIETRYFLSIYEQDPSHISKLLKFAKLDFNLLQKMHQEEISHITSWWKELDVATNLPFARDRLIECYFWALGVYFEPQYAFARKKLTKAIATASIIDDMYDAYGTLEELDLFTQASERWAISEIDQLPDYMKYFYNAMLDVYAEMGDELRLEDAKLYRVDYAIEAIKGLIKAYFKEAEWFHAKYVPTMEEYMTLALVTSGYFMVATTSFVGMDDIVTRNSFEWLFSYPKFLKASEMIARLMDDIASNEFEQKRGHVASAVECYMNQYGGTKEEAVNKLREQVRNAWKDINEEWINPNSVPMPLRMRILNLARVIDLLYKDGDYYTNSGGILKDIITSILIDPVTL